MWQRIIQATGVALVLGVGFLAFYMAAVISAIEESHFFD